MEQQEKKWYVVRAISGKEKKAKEYIESEMAKRGWSNDVPTVLIPTEQVVSIRNGKKVVKDRTFLMCWTSFANAKASLFPCVSRKSTASLAKWMSKWMVLTLWTVSLLANR